MKPPICCTPKQLPQDRWVEAAAKARSINPVNHPPIERLVRVMPSFAPDAMRLAVLTTKYWKAGKVRLTVAFLDNAPAALRTRILRHMNAWAKTANVRFVQTKADPQVRIARAPDGYWSYIGTDILLIKRNEPTMNLEAFTMQTPESEFRRVVRHETGHTMGFPHEHMRKELVDLIDRAKAIAYFGQTQGWSSEEVQAQVLTPLEEASLLGTPHADMTSIMCYQIPGTITKSGNPITGGRDINKQDFEFSGKVYPKA